MNVPTLLALATSGLTLRSSAPPCALHRAPAATSAAIATARDVDSDALTPTETSELQASLRRRMADIEEGAGKRYRVESLVGFLNVHA
jgi:hypothetical protein